MHPTLSNTPEEQAGMLAEIGKPSMDSLFDTVPSAVRLGRALHLPQGLSEMEVAKRVSALAKCNCNTEEYVCFLGAGVYDHFIPCVIDNLLSRQEFYTAYTPYQPEISQGTLQAIFEYQSMICALTGMDVSNASMYDGASAVAEAASMACQATGRSGILAARSLHPQSRQVLGTYARFREIAVDEVSAQNGTLDMEDLGKKLNDNTAAVIVQTPNFFGVIEDITGMAEMAHKNGSLLIVSCDPVSLALLKSPGEMGADIAVGEGQSLGQSMSFGGPYLGFFAAAGTLLRRMPGRIVGQTVDAAGRRGYVLTIQTREQHIRREKATSNICSNEALNALAATMYLTAMGPKGLREAASQCMQKSHYARNLLMQTGLFKPLFDAPFFKEFSLAYTGDTAKLNRVLFADKIIGGYELEKSYPEYRDSWMVAVTEKRTKDEIDALARKAAEA